MHAREASDFIYHSEAATYGLDSLLIAALFCFVLGYFAGRLSKGIYRASSQYYRRGRRA